MNRKTYDVGDRNRESAAMEVKFSMAHSFQFVEINGTRSCFLRRNALDMKEKRRKDKRQNSAAAPVHIVIKLGREDKEERAEGPAVKIYRWGCGNDWSSRC